MQHLAHMRLFYCCRLDSELLDRESQHKRGGAQYELIATVSHHGQKAISGHYTADVLQPNGKWLRFDDDKVSYVSQLDVTNNVAYLLLYRKVG